MSVATDDWTVSFDESDRRYHPASFRTGSSATSLDTYVESAIPMVRTNTVSPSFSRTASLEEYTFVDANALEQITLGSELVAEFRKHFETLRTLADEPYTWGDPDEERPNEWARYYAQTALITSLAINLLPTRIIPSAEGGVTITFYNGDRYADIECFNSGDILAMTKRGSERADIWPVRLERISDALGRIDEFIR